ncbi:MAG: ubiquinol-cytochrome c reductase iron-sulfur subunit [Parasphingorhabdus sp.]|uniref:ubiquinol-cytochrome c reductase iron-sulfur subunit n=1 Tax=Parasphingorhabdus sp. TaxID=2709688 RepID=UPI0030029689
METFAEKKTNLDPAGIRRRDFIHIAPVSFAAVGLAASAIPLVDSMNPSADVLAVAVIEVDLSSIEPGQRITVSWRNQPIFIVRRTANDITRARADDANPALIDPASDSSRVLQTEWLIMIGVCTHLGCIPLGQKEGDMQGKYGGWFCPCHGSLYDASGRVRRGPAPRNLDIPPYVFLSGTQIRIG